MTKDSVRATGVVTADVALLWFARPHPSALRRLVERPGESLAEFGADRVIALGAGAAVWLAAAWVAVVLLAVAGSGLPGSLGRACAGAGRLVVPAALRRVVVVALGFGVVAGPVTAAAAASPSPCVPSGVSSSLAVTEHTPPGPRWPVAPAPHPPAPHPPAPHAPAPHAPAPHAPAPHAPATNDEQVRVRAGDSLWLIAARRLPANAPPGDIASYWPRVYAANRAVVGTDPNRIRPGQVLRLPDPVADST